MTAEDEEVLNKRYYKHRKLPLDTVEKKVISKKKIKEKYEQAVVETVQSSDWKGSIASDEFAMPEGDDGLDSLRKRLQVILVQLLYMICRQEFAVARVGCVVQERIQHLKQTRIASGDKSKEHSDRKTKREEARKKSAKFGAAPSAGNTKKAGLLGSIGSGEASTGSMAVQSNNDDRRCGIDAIQSDTSKGTLSAGRRREESVEDGGDIMYSGLVDSSAKSPQDGAGQPGSKTRRLQRMIAEAEKKRNRQEQLKAMGSEGKQRCVGARKRRLACVYVFSD